MFGKIANFLFGMITGALLGSVVVSMVTPQSGKEIRDNLKNSFDEIVLDYELGKQQKREDLEAEIKRRWGE